MKTVLVGNTFPLTLVRRECRINPISLEAAKSILSRGFISFWGHANTITAAQAQLGVDVTPETERPALTLNKDGLPGLDGVHTDTVLVLSPRYRQGFRPAIGVEVSAEDIEGWEPLLITFTK